MGFKKWPHFYLEISSFETSARMIFLAIGAVDIIEGVFNLVGGGGDQTVAPLVQCCLTIKKVSGECNDLRHDLIFFSKNEIIVSEKLPVIVMFGEILNAELKKTWTKNAERAQMPFFLDAKRRFSI